MSAEKEGGEIEEKIAIVDQWVRSLTEYDENGHVEVAEIDRQLITEVLIDFGANLEPGPELGALKKYSNKAKRAGMDAVWGSERVTGFNKWTTQWVDGYEEETGKRLPALNVSGAKTSGLRHLLGELTAYAAGAIESEEYKELMEARLRNGWLWDQGRKRERVRVQLPTSKEPKLLASIPPGFAKDAWEYIKSGFGEEHI